MAIMIEKINTSLSVKKLIGAMQRQVSELKQKNVYFDYVSRAIVSVPVGETKVVEKEVVKEVEKEIDKVALKSKLVDIDGISNRLADEILELL